MWHTFSWDIIALCRVDKFYRRTLCFFDVTMRQWYMILVDATSLLAPLDGTVPCLLAVNDDLICKLCASHGKDKEYKLVLFDLVAKSRWKLLESSYEHDNPVHCIYSRHPPTLVAVVDNATSSFKVFFLNCIAYESTDSYRALKTRFFVYESSTGAWRSLPSPPKPHGGYHLVSTERGLRNSLVFFHGKFYTISYHPRKSVILLSYCHEKNQWRHVLEFGYLFKPRYPQLHVFNNNLFMGMWNYVFPEDGNCYDECDVKEILVNENVSRLLVQIPSKDLEHAFDGVYLGNLQFALTFNSVVMISDVSGKAITFDLKSRSFGELPEHPLQISSKSLNLILESDEEELDSDEEDEPYITVYRAQLMNMSLKNILYRCAVSRGSYA